MPNIISDDPAWADGYPPDASVEQPTISAQLENGFDSEADFYVYEGRPVAVWGMQDFAIDYSTYPIREVHPFGPAWHGKQITESEFRTLVKAIHRLG